MTTKPLVCIVDDAADYRLILKHLFNHRFSSYSVHFFADGQELLNELPGLTLLPNLIVLDRHMPHLDGHQTLLELKTHSVYKKIPVVMMSAEASAQEINNCYEAGVNSFLRKPVDFNVLKDQFDTILRYWLKLNQQPVEIGKTNSPPS